MIATEECLLNPNRNPELSREQIERTLHEYLGTEKMVWLGRGVFDDETDGHVDNLACFAEPGKVLLTWTDDESDPQHEISVDAVAGTLPRRAGDRLAASYVNFFLGSRAVVYPLLDERHDEEAAAILRAAFPDREVIGVAAREILLGGGNIHCITQQVPAIAGR